MLTPPTTNAQAAVSAAGVAGAGHGDRPYSTFIMPSAAWAMWPRRNTRRRKLA
jgi:hypothetical protein